MLDELLARRAGFRKLFIKQIFIQNELIFYKSILRALGKKLSREVSLKLNFVASFFPSKFDQRDYRRSTICY